MLRLVLAWALLGLVAAPVASAASTTQILRDCADDSVLQGHYTAAELRRARQHIPTDTDEYTDCRDVLARAANAAIANSGNGGGGSGSGGGTGGSSAAGGGGTGAAADQVLTPTTPEDQDVIANAAKQGAPDPVRVDGRAVIPGTSGFAAGAVRNELPPSLIVVLALLAASALAACLPSARRHVLGRLKR